MEQIQQKEQYGLYGQLETINIYINIITGEWGAEILCILIINII